MTLLSPSRPRLTTCDYYASADYQQKFDAYQAHGVGEYWIIDPPHQTLEVWAAESGRFVKRGTFGPGESYACLLLGGALIPLHRILGA